MIPLLLPLNRFQHWKSGVMEDTDNLVKGVIESELISKEIVKGLNLLVSPRGHYVNYHDKYFTAAMVFICLSKNR